MHRFKPAVVPLLAALFLLPASLSARAESGDETPQGTAGDESAAAEPAAGGAAERAAAPESSLPAPAEPVPAAPLPAAPVVVSPGVIPQPSGRAAAPAADGASMVAPIRPSPAPAAHRNVIEVGGGKAPERRWRGTPISLSLRDAPLPEVLRTFARIAGVNLILDPGVKGSVTVELKDVPWDQALYVILKTHGMAAEIDGRVWVVAPY